MGVVRGTQARFAISPPSVGEVSLPSLCNAELMVAVQGIALESNARTRDFIRSKLAQYRALGEAIDDTSRFSIRRRQLELLHTVESVLRSYLPLAKA